jgi:hypothetical protein
MCSVGGTRLVSPCRTVSTTRREEGREDPRDVTRIIAVGYSAEVFVPQQPRVHAFPHVLTREDLERLADVVAKDLARERAVIAIYPGWSAEPSLRRLQTVRSALASPRFTTYATGLPPVAGSILCALAAAAAVHVRSAGLIFAGLPVLERQIVTIARLPSVGGLRTPSPSLWQHAVSLLPGVSFAVSWWPKPAVARLRKHQLSVPLPTPDQWRGPALDTVALAGADAKGADWFERTAIPAVGSSYLLPLEPQPLSPTFWGGKRVIEAAAYPSDMAAVGSLLRGAPQPVPCEWCGELVITDYCPFCGADRALVTVAS